MSANIQIIMLKDNQGKDAFTASHSDGVKCRNGGTLTDELAKIKGSRVYLSESEYAQLVEDDEVDENVEYNIYEDEEP